MKSALWPRWYRPAIYANTPAWSVVETVARDFGLTPEEVRSHNRRSDMVAARCVAARGLRMMGLSYPIIGRMLGGRDHKTVMYLHQHFKAKARRRPLMDECLLRVMEGAA